MVNWVNLPMRSFDGLPSDLREYVYSSFVAHNKDVVPAVQPKIDNTEAFVRKIERSESIALRIERACKELGIATVAVHSTADADATRGAEARS